MTPWVSVFVFVREFISPLLHRDAEKLLQMWAVKYQFVWSSWQDAAAHHPFPIYALLFQLLTHLDDLLCVEKSRIPFWIQEEVTYLSVVLAVILYSNATYCFNSLCRPFSQLFADGHGEHSLMVPPCGCTENWWATGHNFTGCHRLLCWCQHDIHRSHQHTGVVERWGGHISEQRNDFNYLNLFYLFSIFTMYLL